ncbi:MAG: transposase [Nanoarchaeota archaeon]
MRVRATTKIRIEPRREIIDTITTYKKGLQICIDKAWELKIRNNVKLHPFVYQELKVIGLPSQLAISCIKQACGIVKKAKTKPFIKFCSIRYNSPRSFSFKNNILSISTINGRVKVPFTTPNCFKDYFSWEIDESLLRIDDKGRCFFLFTFSQEFPAQSSNSQSRVLGVDLGVHNLAVTSDRQFFNSSKVKQIKRKFKFLRSKLQAKGTRSSRRFLKKISGKEKHFMTWVNHNISRKIVDNFDGGKIVMENLKGIRNIRRGKRMNYWISNWSFFQLQSFIQYKAERNGIEVVRVNPKYTSQICSKCGQLGSRSGSSFVCIHCDFSLNADLNSALNLASPMLEKRQAFVTKPYNHCNEAEGSIRPIEAELMVKSPTL